MILFLVTYRLDVTNWRSPSPQLVPSHIAQGLQAVMDLKGCEPPLFDGPPHVVNILYYTAI